MAHAAPSLSTERVVRSVSAGSSLLNGSVTGLRWLSTAGYRSLRNPLRADDPTIDAIRLQYLSSGGSASPAAYSECVHSLLTLSQRWQRYLFFRADGHPVPAPVACAVRSVRRLH